MPINDYQTSRIIQTALPSVSTLFYQITRAQQICQSVNSFWVSGVARSRTEIDTLHFYSHRKALDKKTLPTGFQSQPGNGVISNPTQNYINATPY